MDSFTNCIHCLTIKKRVVMMSRCCVRPRGRRPVQRTRTSWYVQIALQLRSLIEHILRVSTAVHLYEGGGEGPLNSTHKVAAVALHIARNVAGVEWT